ncbi:unnamed protein product, partial [Gongylonema pulchrum]|uniref:WD_REPEATS_REGION domain-containing protein n=1 Tax=Gongylonema pulchrum TaxID=637853 RepID=A0A183DUY3_9BILA
MIVPASLVRVAIYLFIFWDIEIYFRFLIYLRFVFCVSIKAKFCAIRKRMPFFIRNRAQRNGASGGNKLKRKLPQAFKLSKRQAKLANEIISSDEDNLSNDDEGNNKFAASDEEQSQDKHFALQAEQEVEEGQPYDEEAIASRLREDALSKLATLHKSVADTVKLSGTAVQYRAHRYSTVAVAISHDGRYVLSCSKDATLVKYDLEEGKKVATLKHKKGSDQCHQGQIFCIAITGSDRYAVTGGTDSI